MQTDAEKFVQTDIEKFIQINILIKSVQIDEIEIYLFFLNIYIHYFIYNRSFSQQDLICC